MKLELFKDAVLISVVKRIPGNRRKVDLEDVELEVGGQAYNGEKSELHLGKDLLESVEIKDIRHEFNKFGLYLARRRVPGNFFRAGCYVVKKTRLPEIYAEYQARRAGVKLGVDAFCGAYDERRAQAKVRLGNLYREDEYPTEDKFRGAVDLKMLVVELAEPEGIDPAIKAQQAAEAEAEWKDAVNDVRLALRTAMQGFVAHFAERLRPGEDGAKKVITEKKVARFREFLEFFSDRDITDDAKLAELVGQAKGLLDHADVGLMRQDGMFRAQLNDAFGQMEQAVGALVEEQQSRMISF